MSAAFMNKRRGISTPPPPPPLPKPPTPDNSSNTKNIKKDDKFTSLLSSKNKNYAPIKIYMTYNKKKDCIDCKCGSQLWTSTTTKPADLTSHFGTQTHKDYVLAKKNRELNRIAKFQKESADALNDIKDDIKSILYYPFLMPTFICVYFIAIHRLPLHLIYSFNALLVFLGVTCSGLSYLWAVNDIVHAFYITRYNEIKYKIQKSNWYGLTEDESQSKVASTGYLSLAVKYRDRHEHKNRHHQVKLKALKGQKAVTLANATIDFVQNDLELDEDKFLCLTSDNCSTNTGPRGGVFKLVRDIFIYILIFGCFAHKLALAISAALGLCPYFVGIEIIIKRIIKWACAGSNRSRALVDAAKTEQEAARKIGIIHKIRWPGRVNVCEAIFKSKYSSYDSLDTQLSHGINHKYIIVHLVYYYMVYYHQLYVKQVVHILNYILLLQLLHNHMGYHQKLYVSRVVYILNHMFVLQLVYHYMKHCHQLYAMQMVYVINYMMVVHLVNMIRYFKLLNILNKHAIDSGAFDYKYNLLLHSFIEGHEIKSLGYGDIGGHDARSDVYDCEGYHEAMN